MAEIKSGRIVVVYRPRFQESAGRSGERVSSESTPSHQQNAAHFHTQPYNLPGLFVLLMPFKSSCLGLRVYWLQLTYGGCVFPLVSSCFLRTRLQGLALRPREDNNTDAHSHFIHDRFTQDKQQGFLFKASFSKKLRTCLINVMQRRGDTLADRGGLGGLGGLTPPPPRAAQENCDQQIIGVANNAALTFSLFSRSTPPPPTKIPRSASGIQYLHRAGYFPRRRMYDIVSREVPLSLSCSLMCSLLMRSVHCRRQSDGRTVRLQVHRGICRPQSQGGRVAGGNPAADPSPLTTQGQQEGGSWHQMPQRYN